MIVWAVALAALAAVVFLGPAPAGPLRRLAVSAQTKPPRRLLPVRWPVLWVFGLLVAIAVVPALTVWLLSGAVASATVWFLLRAHLARRRERASAAECARSARILAGLLASGQIPTSALREAAMECPVLAPAAEASALGADVGEQLLRTAAEPGRGALRPVAAAWRLSERSGAPVAQILARVAENLRRQQQLAAVVDAELAAARTSGHIMAALPFLAIGLGFAVGVNSLDFLAREPLGQVLALVGVVLTAAGVLWIDALSRPKRGRR